MKPIASARGRWRFGFPVGALRLYLPRLIAAQRTVMVIAERNEYLTAIKTRLPVSSYEPLSGAEIPGGRATAESRLVAKMR
ncbi:MAG: hypothetical protein ACREVS_23660 [Burkholderiales bacterium]